jgi:hypothetical protein
VSVAVRRRSADGGSVSMPVLWLVAIFVGSFELAWWLFWHVLDA